MKKSKAIKNILGFSKVLSAAFLLFLMGSCERVTEPAGPNLFDRFGPFIVVDSLQVSDTIVDFSAGERVSFSAKFNKNIDWLVTITGQTSGAKKILSSFDSLVNTSNATWVGGTTELPLFRNEMCMAVLSVPEEPDFRDTVMLRVAGTIDYEGYLVTDFEEDAGADILLGDFEFELVNSGRLDDTTAAEGNFFYRLQGTDIELDVPNNNFFVGLSRIFATINGEPYFQFPTTVPEQLYMNMFVSGRATPYTRMTIGLIIDSNDNMQFDDGVDEIIGLELDPTYTNWRLESFTAAQMGVTQAQLQKVVGIQIALISLNNLQPTPREQVGFEYDYIIFTPVVPLSIE